MSVVCWWKPFGLENVMKKARLTKLALVYSLGLIFLGALPAKALDWEGGRQSSNYIDCRTGICYNSYGWIDWTATVQHVFK